jgi:hypothetical protein
MYEASGFCDFNAASSAFSAAVPASCASCKHAALMQRWAQCSCCARYVRLPRQIQCERAGDRGFAPDRLMAVMGPHGNSNKA